MSKAQKVEGDRDNGNKSKGAVEEGKGKDEEQDNGEKKRNSTPGADIQRQISATTVHATSKTYLLVINGGGHPAFLGDFFGLVEYFEGRKHTRVDPSFACEYWTTVHPLEYFDTPQIASRGITTIKFDDKIVYTRFQALHRAENYEHVPPMQMLRKIYQWIDLKVDQTAEHGAKPGDTVIMIFLCQGGDLDANPTSKRPEGLLVGYPHKDQILTVANFVAAIRKFPRNVQLNFLSNAYCSGNFTSKIEQDGQKDRWISTAASRGEISWPSNRVTSNRFQNSVFIPAFIRSLGSLKIGSPMTSPTIAAVVQDIQAAMRNPASDIGVSNAVAYTDAHPSTRAITLLLRSMADFPMLPENTNAARRRELSMPYLTRAIPDNPELDGVEFALEVVKMVKKNFGCAKNPFPEGGFPDLGLNPLRETLPDLLRGLLFRGRLQSNVFQVFLQLCQQNVCHVSSLQTPIDFRMRSPLLKWLLRLLGCWKLNQGRYSGSETFTPIADVSSRWHRFDGHFLWLAILIGRSAYSIEETVKVITATKYFGAIDPEAWSQLEACPLKVWQPDPLFCAGDPGQESGFYGFMLPSGIEVTSDTFDKIQVEFWRNFDPIEKAFKRYFQLPPNMKFSLGNQKDHDTDPRDWEQTIYT